MRQLQDLYPSDPTFDCGGVTIQYKNIVLKSVLKDSPDRHKSLKSTIKKRQKVKGHKISTYLVKISATVIEGW